jgi:hypothetical protein
MINIKDYITSLQCAWVKRVTQHWGDMWRFDLKKMCYGNPLIADSGTFDPVRNLVLHNICSSFGNSTMHSLEKTTIIKRRCF